ncbi:YCII-related protein [Kribbella flavida DSM 17836]|uniref:YCII-related protein n=1 Tax=Kribbella flavida (strain DSM 17836 / JCM 10339 / NBRC 14399) TaxID=479435 RepID=D2Q3A2_KRIFD|nr:YciI family protein [Kribbella flavida]ADB32227.1 YCII-related protein [Kribbella flavida DSM 17836]
MKFLILIYGNPAGRELWNGLSEEQKRESMTGYTELADALTASGELLVTHSLDDPALTKQVLVRDGKPVTTDGPFAEIKEQLAGFYLVECESIERAVEIVPRIPEAAFSIVEVRPIRDLDHLG